MKLKQIIEAKYASDNIVDLYIQAHTEELDSFVITITPGINFRGYDVEVENGTPFMVYGYLKFDIASAAKRKQISMLHRCSTCSAKPNQQCRTYGGRKDSKIATRSHENRGARKQLPDDAKIVQILKGFTKRWAKDNNIPYTKLKVIQVWSDTIYVKMYHDKAYVEKYDDFWDKKYPDSIET